MNITYTQDKNISESVLLDFLATVNHPALAVKERLLPAMLTNGTLITAWDEDAEHRLAALISVIDDGGMNAYVRFMIVGPDYRGKGINDELLQQVKTIYADYPNLTAIAEDDFHAGFFTKVGFKLADNAKVLTR